MPQLVSIDRDNRHCGLLSTTDEELIETLMALLQLYTEYRVRMIAEIKVEPKDPFLKQFGF